LPPDAIIAYIRSPYSIPLFVSNPTTGWALFIEAVFVEAYLVKH
jgi:hypothetical protein